MTLTTNTHASQTLKASGILVVEAKHEYQTVEITHFDDFLKMVKEANVKFVFATPIFLTSQHLISGREGNPIVADHNKTVNYFISNPIDIIYSFVFEGTWFSYKVCLAKVDFIRDKKVFINSLPAYMIARDYATFPEETV